MQNFQPKSKKLETAVVVPMESYESIGERIRSRFEVLDNLTQCAISGEVRSLFVAGPKGLGKSFSIETALVESGNEHDIVRGFSRATGLYKALYENRETGRVLLMDDADGIFADPVALNLIKSATDTSKKRWVSWRAETKMEDSNGDILPTRFEFEGSLIFITNLDFFAMIAKGHALAPHLEAIIDRSFYLDLEMKTVRDYYVRIEQVCIGLGMLEGMGLDKAQVKTVMRYLEEHMKDFHTFTLRTATKLAQLIKRDPNWQQTAKYTLLKQGVR